MGIGTIALGTALFGAATGVASYVEQRNAARKAAKEQEHANDIAYAQAQVENARQRRRAIAQARIAQAANLANQSQEVQASSALSGVQSSISAQLGANIGAQNQQIGTQLGSLNAQQNAADALRRGQERAGMYTLLGNLGQMAGTYGMQNFGTAAPSSPQGSFLGGMNNASSASNASYQNFSSYRY